MAARPGAAGAGGMGIDDGDIYPFFVALQDPTQYAAEHPDCDMFNGDMNGDGILDGADIWPFFERLSGGA